MKTINLILLTFFIAVNGFSQIQQVWLDADTGNEMDDLYAIVRLLKHPSIQLVGLSSAHFNNSDLLVFEKWNGYETKGLISVKESQRLNEQILKALGRLAISHPLGADRQVGRAWGQEDPRPSAASMEIIKAVKSLPTGQRLDIITLGALTNIATAIMIAPEIVAKIRCFSLGARYNPQTKNWNKNELNIRNDLNAFDFLLNKEGFEFIVMPLDAAYTLQFKREETYQKLDTTQEIQTILKRRWQEHNPQDEVRVMWDLALVEAYLKPSSTTIVQAFTPPENRVREIKVYTKIDEVALVNDFWKVLIEK